MGRVRVSLSVYTETAELAARVVEQFARTAAGLAFDNVESFLSCGPDDEEDSSGP